MGLTTRFEEMKHPRGWHGRFSGNSGTTPAANALKVKLRPTPSADRRKHAVVPHIKGVSSHAITFREGATQATGD